MVRFALIMVALHVATSLSAAEIVMETPADLPGFTIYRPAMNDVPLPILAWGNGGCANLGNSAASLLGEIAAHGYLVIAIGPIGEPLQPSRPARAGTPEQQLQAVVASSGPAPTRPEQLIEALDWAERAAQRGGLAGKIAADRVAIAGHSCGGLQAIAASSDSRVDTTVLLNSGVFEQPRVKVTKADLAKLHGPIAYFIGGPSDMAYANAEDDFARIDHVPVLKANNTFGHGGRLRDERGGPTATWVVRWLDWQLKGDAAGKQAFVGMQCELCREPGWTIERKKLE